MDSSLIDTRDGIYLQIESRRLTQEKDTGPAVSYEEELLGLRSVINALLDEAVA